MGGFRRRLGGVFCCLRRRDAQAAATADHHNNDINTPTSQHGLFAASEKAAPPPPAAELTPFQQQARQIAQIPVAGMRRTTAPGGGAYVASYQTAQHPNPRASPSAPKTMPSNSTMASSHDTTVVGVEEHFAPRDDKMAPAAAPWQGKPTGTPYDRRTELTEEDEDTWARMAM